MPKVRAIAVLALTTATMPSMASEPIKCARLSPMDFDLNTFNEYVWLLRFAFSHDRPANMCREYGLEHRTPGEISGLRKIPLIPSKFSPKSSFVVRIVNNFKERWSIYNAQGLYASKDKHGYYHYHISCVTKTPDVPRLAITIMQVVQWVNRLVEGDTVAVRVNHFFLDVGLIASDDFLRSITDREGVEIRHLVRVWPDPDQDPKEENLFLIRGTQLTIFQLVPQLRASINDMIDKSCAFSLAAEIARLKSEEYDFSDFSVVGHSLGGAVATYIANDRRENPDNYGGSTFSAYSFSSVGLKDADTVNIDDLYSYRIKDDPFAFMDQVGLSFVYHPQDGFGGRHRLKQVQKSICECLNGQGEISGSFLPERS